VIGLLGRRRPPIICYLPVWPPLPIPPLPIPPWPPFPGPPCYLPPDWLIKGVEQEVRINLAKRFLEGGVIGQEVYDKLI
jgi:hypothetical protein